MNPTVAVIEPHYDDAWLSLGGTMLTHPETGFFIVSVSRSAENPEPAPLETHLPNVATHDLSLVDLGWNRRAVGRRRKDAGVADWRALFDLENELHPGELEARIEAALPPGIEWVCLPLGLVHPMHDVVSRLSFARPTLRYFEYPYGFFAGWEEALADRTAGLTEQRIDVAAVTERKRAMFETLYPGQRDVLSIARCSTPLEGMLEERVYGEAGSWLSM